jgi:DNA polymerase elongation subunit (family B)
VAEKFVNGFVDGGDLVLLHRNERGEMLARRRKAEWSSFYRREDVSADVLRDLRNSGYVVGISEEGDWLRVRWGDALWRAKAHEEGGWAESLGLRHFEADVDPIRRYFSESGAEVAKPRRVYLDIETDSRVQPVEARKGKARVLCYALVDEAGELVAREALAEDSDDAESRLLASLWVKLEPFDQVVAWYGDGFDFPVIRTRSEILGVRRKDERRWLWLDFLPVYERMNRNASDSGAEKESMSLQNVAMSRLGEGKDDFDARKTWEAWAAGGAERERMLAYCAKDTALLQKLNAKTGFLDVNDAICEVGRLFADTQSANPTNYVDGFLLRMGVERGTRFASKKSYSKDDEEKREKFAGAFVMEPKAVGIERDIHVADFAGMYPSIILTWNMSPETKVMVAVNGPIGVEGACRAPSTRQGFLVGTPGILPEALKRVREMRKHWQKKQASLPPGTPEWAEAGRLSTAYKVIANSFYGVVGSPFSRFFDRSIAESVTQNGVWLIKRTIDEAEKRGWEVIYSDTDSIFVKGPERGEFDEFVRWCNAELYPRLVAESGARENYIEIAYEKQFSRVVFVSAKKYAAVYAHYKWVATCSCTTTRDEPGALDVRTMTCRDCGTVHTVLPPPRGKPEIRGLEYKRGDVIRIARELQLAAIRKLMVDLSEEPLDFVPLVEAVRRRVLDEPLPIEEVRLSKSLSKSLREYEPKKKKDGEAAAEPPHVQVARVLKSRGEQVGSGSRVEYYVVDASSSPMKVAPAADYDGNPDRYYLWENLIYPATQRLLEAAFPVRQGMTAEELRARDWAQYERARPRAARAAKAQPEGGPAPRRGRSAVPEQGGLFGAPASATGPGPLVVEVGEGDRLGAAREALERHPGDREVVLRVRTPEGVAELACPQRVAVSPELLRELEGAKKSVDERPGRG